MDKNTTTARGIRVDSQLIPLIEKRAKRKGWSFNRWIGWCIGLGIRSHKAKKE